MKLLAERASALPERAVRARPLALMTWPLLQLPSGPRQEGDDAGDIVGLTEPAERDVTRQTALQPGSHPRIRAAFSLEAEPSGSATL